MNNRKIDRSDSRCDALDLNLVADDRMGIFRKSSASTLSIIMPPSSQGLFQSGDIIGKYLIGSILQQDALGVLYAVRHLLTGESFLLKTLPASVALEKPFQDRIRYEGLLLARLHHPNILGLIERVQGPEQCHLVLESCDGVPLANWMSRYVKNGHGAPATDVKPIIKQILSGLAHIHNAALAHRRIEPSNIFLTKSGEIKISGFSLVRGARVSSNREGLTVAEYSELPEQWPDIYAVGILAYYFLTGLNPKDSAQPASMIVTGLDRKWDVFIRTCVECNTTGPFKNGTDALEEFNRLLA